MVESTLLVSVTALESSKLFDYYVWNFDDSYSGDNGMEVADERPSLQCGTFSIGPCGAPPV